MTNYLFMFSLKGLFKETSNLYITRYEKRLTLHPTPLSPFKKKVRDEAKISEKDGD